MLNTGNSLRKSERTEVPGRGEQTSPGVDEDGVDGGVVEVRVTPEPV